MCKRKHWRKTFQWISLTREHAELIAWEQEINKGFRDLCHPHQPETGPVCVMQ